MTRVYHPHIPAVQVDVSEDQLSEYLAAGWRERDPFRQRTATILPAPTAEADQPTQQEE